MIEPNAHYELYESGGREPDQAEQNWLRTEEDEQDWLRAEQAILTQQRSRSPSSARVPCAYRSAQEGIPMDCLECKNLEEAFDSSLSQYIEARSAAYYRVSTELAAKKNVDMERARNDLEEHRLICIPAGEVRPSGLRAISSGFGSRPIISSSISQGPPQPARFPIHTESGGIL